MYIMDYDSVKLTNYVQRFCIIQRVRGDVAEFTLLVQLVNNERDEMLLHNPRDANVNININSRNFLVALMRLKCYTFQ